jgi:glycosyltransferase involved in cell wall biosynthesis
VFAAIVPRLFGAKVLLDLQECMPEFFAMKYRLAPRHPIVRLLGLAERASIAFADSVLTCTEQMRGRFIERGASAAKIDVVLLSSDEAVFDPDHAVPAPREPGTFLLTFHGTLEESFGPDTVIRAVALLKDEIPGLRLKLFGNGTFRQSLQTLITELGVADRVWLADGFVPLPELVSAIASADAGVVPTRRSAFRDLTHSTKMFDLLAMRRPAIVARTASVEAYFDASCFQLFESGDPHDLARAIRELRADPTLGPRLVRGAAARSEPYRWIHQRRRYLEIVDGLIATAHSHDRLPSLVADRGEEG